MVTNTWLSMASSGSLEFDATDEASNLAVSVLLVQINCGQPGNYFELSWIHCVFHEGEGLTIHVQAEMQAALNAAGARRAKFAPPAPKPEMLTKRKKAEVDKDCNYWLISLFF